MSKQRKNGKKSVFGTVMKWIAGILGTLILIGCATGAILACYAASYIQDVIMPEVKSSNANLVTDNAELSSSILYYDDVSDSYQPLQTLYSAENRVWIDYEDVPKNLVNATVAIEDKRFWKHTGVDWKRTAAAVVYMFTGKNVQGGSTITQQLIKNLTQQDQVTVKRKVLEIFEALEFEKSHTKEQIMEWYLNEIYLGRGCYGVVTASQKYFGKEVQELDLAQCAALISITNNPSYYDPYNHPDRNLKRRNTVLDELCSQGYISEAERDAAKAEEIVFTNGSSDSSDDSVSTPEEYYSWYTDAVIEQVIDDLQAEYGYDEQTASNMLYSGGLQIYACFDPAVQANVDAVYTDMTNVEGSESVNGEQLQSAITVVDNSTGAVVALAGGVGEKTGNRLWNRATDSLRPPGSSIKPLSSYAPALELGIITPSTVFNDSPFEYINGDPWPTNSHGGYTGNMSVYNAVVESTNTVAVKVLDSLAEDSTDALQTSFDFMTERFGINSLVDSRESSTGKVYSDLNYASLALGGLTDGVSTYEMAAAYAAFPNEGSYASPYLYTAVVNSKGEALLTTDGYTVASDYNGNVTISGTVATSTILSASTCYYMNEMLEGVISEGTGTSAQLDSMSCAGKTGTTTNDNDRWFVGYTPYYTAAVWSGYDMQSKIQAAANPSVTLWQKVMNLISANQEDIGFQLTEPEQDMGSYAGDEEKTSNSDQKNESAAEQQTQTEDAVAEAPQLEPDTEPEEDDTTQPEQNEEDTTQEDTTQEDTTQEDTTQEDTTQEDTTQEDTTQEDTTQEDTTQEEDTVTPPEAFPEEQPAWDGMQTAEPEMPEEIVITN